MKIFNRAERYTLFALYGSMLLTDKKISSLRICLDPRDLNHVIKREHFVIPTAEDVLLQLRGKKYFPY